MSRPTFPTIWTNRTPIDRRRQDKCATVNGWRQWLWIVSSQHDALIIHKRLRQGCGVSFSRTVPFLSGVAAAMYVHDDSFPQQLTLNARRASAYGVLNTILPKTHPCLPHDDGRFQRPVRDLGCIPTERHADALPSLYSEPWRVTKLVTQFSFVSVSPRSRRCFLTSVTPEGIPNTTSRMTWSNALTKPTNNTKKDFLRFLQTSTKVTRMWVACALLQDKNTIFETTVLEVWWNRRCHVAPARLNGQLHLKRTGWVAEAWQCTGRTAVTVPDVTDRLVDAKGPPRAVAWERVACDGAVTWGSKTPSQMQWLVPAVLSSPQAECHRPMQIPSGAFPVDAELEGGGHKKMTLCDRPFNLVGNEQVLFHKLNLEAHIMVSRLTFSV